MERIMKGTLAVFLVVTVFFAGCVGQSKPEGKEPMVIIRASISDPESVDPAFDYETAGGEIIENVYERLVWYDGAAIDKFIPWLAESYTVSPSPGTAETGRGDSELETVPVQSWNGRICFRRCAGKVRRRRRARTI